MGPALPLKGIRVLDLTRNVAGPYATMILAELGADVVKIESPDGGDDTRAWGPPFWEGFSSMFLALNRNKRSVVLHLRESRSQAVMEALVDRSDVMVESFRPGSMDALGFGYEWAAARNPGLVYTSITAYGNRGPLRDRPGYDPLMQAFGGIMSVTGEADRPPVRVGVSLIDLGTGMWAAMATLAALLERKDTGAGRHIVTSLYETTLAWMSNHFSAFWAGGTPGRRHGSGTNAIVPYQAFPTADGHLIIGVANDNLFLRLARAVGHPEWAIDERFATNPARVANRDALVAAIEAETQRRTTSQLATELLEAGVPCSDIRDVSQVSGDTQAEALGIFQTIAGAPSGFRSVGLPFVMDAERPALRRFPPKPGQHTKEVFGELGLQDLAQAEEGQE